jgi:hypothetical protein
MALDRRDDTIATQYLEAYAAAIGDGLSSADIEDACAYIQDAAEDKSYKNTLSQPYAYIMLDKDGWEKKIATFADRWATVSCVAPLRYPIALTIPER